MLYNIAAPDANQQEHRGQLYFPEQEEEQQIERHEDAHHACFQQQQQCHVFFDSWFFPAAYDCQHSQQGIQNDHRQAQTVHAQEVINAESETVCRKVNPWQVYWILRTIEVTEIVAVESDLEK